MTPIKLADFLAKTRRTGPRDAFDLSQVGMHRAAPNEGDRIVQKMRYDVRTGRLQAVPRA